MRPLYVRIAEAVRIDVPTVPVEFQSFTQNEKTMEMRVKRPVFFILRNLQRPDGTQEAVTFKADSFDFRISRKQPDDIGKLLIGVIDGGAQLVRIRVPPGKDDMVNVIMPGKRIQEGRILPFPLSRAVCLSARSDSLSLADYRGAPLYPCFASLCLFLLLIRFYCT